MIKLLLLLNFQSWQKHYKNIDEGVLIIDPPLATHWWFKLKGLLLVQENAANSAPTFDL